MKIKPIGIRVVIEQDDVEETTSGGIIIPDSAKEKPLQGTVHAVGPGVPPYQMQTREGQKVLYQKDAGHEVEIEGKTFLIIKESDIFAVLDNR